MANDKTCLTCKFEPIWSKPTKGEYSRQWGMCNWDLPIPELPASYVIHIEGITRFVNDDSGVKTRCKTWTAK